MQVHALPILDSNFLFVIEEDSNVIAVDPGDAKPLLNFLEARPELNFTDVLITHEHGDHIHGVPSLQKHFPHVRWHGGVHHQQNFYTHRHQVGDSFQIGTLSFSVLDLSGHTTEQIGFYFKDQNWLFSGDALFHLGCGRIFAGTLEEHFAALQRIKSLPPQTQVFCSHDYTECNKTFMEQVLGGSLKDYANAHQMPLDLGIEMAFNPFLTADLTEFKRLRLLRDQF